MTDRYTFTGHDTFHCRPFWLKKGYDYVKMGKAFNDDGAVLDLGVGRNMVTAIGHWLQAFNVLDDNGELTELAKNLFEDDGWDPFLEDEGTLWLLHFHLHQRRKADVFHLIFSGLAKKKPEFTLKHFQDFVNDSSDPQNFNTLKSAFTVFYRTYFGKKDTKDLEESFTGILTELNLLEETRKLSFDIDGKVKDKPHWHIPRKKRPSIPPEILLYCILKNENYQESISFKDLYSHYNGIGTIFALSEDGLTEKLNEIQQLHKKQIVYSTHAGIRELQFKKQLNAMNILKDYYGN